MRSAYDCALTCWWCTGAWLHDLIMSCKVEDPKFIRGLDGWGRAWTRADSLLVTVLPLAIVRILRGTYRTLEDCLFLLQARLKSTLLVGDAGYNNLPPSAEAPPQTSDSAAANEALAQSIKFVKLMASACGASRAVPTRADAHQIGAALRCFILETAPLLACSRARQMHGSYSSAHESAHPQERALVDLISCLTELGVTQLSDLFPQRPRSTGKQEPSVHIQHRPDAASAGSVGSTATLASSRGSTAAATGSTTATTGSTVFRVHAGSAAMIGTPPALAASPPTGSKYSTNSTPGPSPATGFDGSTATVIGTTMSGTPSTAASGGGTAELTGSTGGTVTAAGAKQGSRAAAGAAFIAHHVLCAHRPGGALPPPATVPGLCAVAAPAMAELGRLAFDAQVGPLSTFPCFCRFVCMSGSSEQAS